MRTPDINRVARAREHLKAALTVLNSIKLKDLPECDYHFLEVAIETITEADGPLEFIINLEQL